MTKMRQEIEENALKLVRHYEKACKVPCQLLDLENPERFTPGCPAWNPEAPCKGCPDCHKVLAFNASQAKRFGGSYAFFCKSSLMYWVSPIIGESMPGRIILAGPVRVVEEEEIREELAANQPNLPDDFEQRLAAIPCVTPDEIHSMSEILRMCASWASGYQEHSMTDSWQAMSGRSELFQVIEELKETESMPLYATKEEEILRQSIMGKEYDAARKSLGKLLGMVFYTTRDNPFFLKIRLQELITVMSRASLCANAGQEAIWQISERSCKNLYLFQDFDRIYNTMVRILGLFCDQVPAAVTGNYGKSTLDAIAYANQNYQRQIKLADVAAHVRLSVSRFCKTFRDDTQGTWTEYLNGLRIEKAKLALRTSELSIMQIAEETGFSDQGYFDRVFRKTVGISPREYRKDSGTYPSDTNEIH
jgi:two-component system response regulator YesN